MSEKYKVRDHEHAHFMTLTVVGWVDVFTRKSHRTVIVDALNYCCRNKGLDLYGWCLMSNHLHLIGQAREGFTLPEIIRDFKKHTSKQIIGQILHEPESRREWMLDIFAKEAGRLKRVSGYKFWQDGFQPKELNGNRFIAQKIRYVHANPVVAGFVEQPEDWVYSSAVNYADNIGLVEVIVLQEAQMFNG
jgi:REP element-mobilizing transposase RayT